MTELSDHYMRVRDYARRFSLDESTVYKMIDRGEIKAIRIARRPPRTPRSRSRLLPCVQPWLASTPRLRD